MSKRFSETEIWEEDWFLDMPNNYKLFWFYMLSKCDHAGIFKVNLRSFRGLLEVEITATEALGFYNSDKQRIRVINDGIWFIEDFFVFQYGEVMNLNNRVHESVSIILNKYNIALASIRGLKDLKDRVKDKDKDIVENNKKEEDKIINGETSNIVGSDVAVKSARKAWEDQAWREQTCMAHSIGEEDLKKWMAQYNASVANDNILGFNENKYKKMFSGWLNTQKAKGYTLTEKPKSTAIGLRTLKPES